MLNGQSRLGTWVKGWLVLMDGRELNGEVNYNLRNRKVQLRRPGGLEVFKEKEIKQMTLRQADKRLDLELVAYKGNEGKIVLTLAEIAYQSEQPYSFIKIYEARESLTVYTFNGPEKVPVTPDVDNDSFVFDRPRIAYIEPRRYLLNYEGRKVALTRKSFLELHKDKRKQLRKYADKNQIRFTMDKHVIDMLRYYEELKRD